MGTTTTEESNAIPDAKPDANAFGSQAYPHGYNILALRGLEKLRFYFQRQAFCHSTDKS